MHHARIALTLALSAPALAQFPCVAGSSTPPAVSLTCPCSPNNVPLALQFLGNGRIGYMQRVLFNWSVFGVPPAVGFLAVGTPSVAPIPLPAGLLICSDGTAVPSVQIDAVAVYAQTPQLLGAQTQINYYLYIPSDPNLVGMTIAWQGFSLAAGFGSPPMYPTQLMGLTIQP